MIKTLHLNITNAHMNEIPSHMALHRNVITFSGITCEAFASEKLLIFQRSIKEMDV